MVRLRVSVIICTYNYGRFLDRCIDSVLTQDDPPDEVIVVDDGSTDETTDVLSSYKSVCVLRQENAGKTSAFNRGFARSTGDVICHLDADDYWLPHKLEKLRRIFAEYAVGAVTHSAISVDGSGELLVHRSRRNMDLPDKPIVINFQEALLSCFLYQPGNAQKKTLGLPNTVSVLRGAVEDLMPLPLDLGLAVDGALLLGAARHRLLFLRETLSAYRRHDGNYFAGVQESQRFQIRLFQWLLEVSMSSDQKDVRIIKALINENKAHFAMQMNRGVVEGVAESALLIRRLFRSGLLPHWKHFGLPIACLFRLGGA